MSWLFTLAQQLEGYVNVRASMMDDAESLAPYIETCTNEKLSWATTGAVHSFPTFPGPDEFPALLAEFAERPA